LVSTGIGSDSALQDADIVFAHWIGKGFFSLRDMRRLGPRLVPVLADHWFISGVAHYPPPSKSSSPLGGFAVPKLSQIALCLAEGVSRLLKIWALRKVKYAVITSKGLASLVSESHIGKTWKIQVIPLPLDTSFWAPPIPIQQAEIEAPDFVLLFLTMEPLSSTRKGADLLFSAISSLPNRVAGRRVRLKVAGVDDGPETCGHVKVEYLGLLSDEAIREAYWDASVVVVPSRIEAYGQVAAESQACGTPVIAFCTGGLVDIIDNGVTGVLVPEVDSDALAQAVIELAQESELTRRMGLAARQRAQKLWSPEVIGQSYIAFLDGIRP
jgi:glycosyltransferase involved in cell wall biosynthesis